METNPKIWNLSSSVQIQAEAVVSRTIVNQKSGTVTLFGFDQSQGLSEHTTPYDALVQVVEGKLEISISNETYIVKSGEMILMPANQPHSLQAIQPSRLMLVMIRS
jgi:quercetin dioxygenase-like cupin family protein